jgi:hypothetical protein
MAHPTQLPLPFARLDLLAAVRQTPSNTAAASGGEQGGWRNG